VRKEIEYKILPNGCWECTSHSANNGGIGYPQIARNGKHYRLSRYMYEKHIGEIPENMMVRHKCDNRLCINPDHLELGTHKDNMRDMIERGRSVACGKHGSAPVRAKLNEGMIIDIRNRLAKKEKQKDIAKIYGVNPSCISKIAIGRRWKTVLPSRAPLEA
jgi:hypothetical protein